MTSIVHKETNLDLNFISYAEMNSIGITDVNVKCKTRKPLENYRGENLQDVELRTEFSDLISKT